MSKIYKCHYLTKTKLKTFLAVANRIIPADKNSQGGGTMQTAGIVDWSMRKMDGTIRAQVLLLIFVVEILGFFFGLKPFSRNSPEAQDRQLRWMEYNPIPKIRLGFFGLKTFVCMGYYTREDIWKDMNYEGPIFPEKTYSDSTIRQICNGRMQVVG
jgi:hypothetical protein